MIEKALVKRTSKAYWAWIAFLAALFAVGFAAYIYQMVNGFHVTGMSRDISWGMYIGHLTFFVGVAAGGVAGIGLSANAGSDSANGSDGGAVSRDLVGTKQVNQWNYKEVITATFEWDTLNCHKCTRVQQCSKTRRPWIGNKYCQTWEEPVETCTDTQF